MSPTERGLKRYDESTGKKPNFRKGQSHSQLNVRSGDDSEDEDSDPEKAIEESLAGLTGLELSVKRWDLNR